MKAELQPTAHAVGDLGLALLVQDCRVTDEVASATEIALGDATNLYDLDAVIPSA